MLNSGLDSDTWRNTMSLTYIDFAFVKENASFERVLEHYNLETRGTGPQRSICCPFHPDKRPRAGSS